MFTLRSSTRRCSPSLTLHITLDQSAPTLGTPILVTTYDFKDVTAGRFGVFPFTGVVLQHKRALHVNPASRVREPLGQGVHGKLEDKSEDDMAAALITLPHADGLAGRIHAERILLHELDTELFQQVPQTLDKVRVKGISEHLGNTICVFCYFRFVIRDRS